jgi:hypothetical protein
VVVLDRRGRRRRQRDLGEAPELVLEPPDVQVDLTADGESPDRYLSPVAVA